MIIMIKKNCPICSGDGKVILKRVWDSSKRKVLRCVRCETVFLSPMMTEEEAERFYTRYDDYLKKREPNKQEYLDTQKKEMLSAQQLTKVVRPYLRKSDLFCDIGAAHGYFLSYIRPFVKEVIAVEPSVDARKKLNDKKIKALDSRWLDEIAPNKLRLNAVSLFHTFEHLSNPKKYLNKLKPYLEPGALIFVEVPNVDDALLSLYEVEAFKKFYFQSMHCFYYNPKTLINVFVKCGFKLEDILYKQRYGISNHLNWLANGRPGGNITFEKMFGSCDKLYRKAMIDNEQTDSILAIFKNSRRYVKKDKYVSIKKQNPKLN